MTLSGLHFLLTYQCTHKCDHCFTWGSPRQQGVMSGRDIRDFLAQAAATGSIERIAFEGGEPFLYYPILLDAVCQARAAGFGTNVVSNAFWATTPEDAVTWLRPFAGCLDKLSVSSDLLHGDAAYADRARNAQQAAAELGIDIGVLATAHPACPQEGQGGVMYRGRAAVTLAVLGPGRPWEEFTTCPCEALDNPARVHLDAFGNLHICQGIIIGNMLRTPLAEICARFDPHAHPITGPLLAGGPAELARRYGVTPAATCADACHLCDTVRHALRPRFPEELGPEQMYGEAG